MYLPSGLLPVLCLQNNADRIKKLRYFHKYPNLMLIARSHNKNLMIIQKKSQNMNDFIHIHLENSESQNKKQETATGY